MGDREADQLRTRLDPELLEQLGAVDLDRPHAEEEVLTDLAVGVAERQQAQQFALALAQPFQRVGLELGQRPAQLGVDVGAASGRDPDRLGQLALGGLLEHVAGGAGAEQVARPARVVLHREHDDRGRRGRSPAGPGCPARGSAPGICRSRTSTSGRRSWASFGGGGRVRGLADHPQVGLCLEHAPQAGPDQVVIVGQDDSYLLLSLHMACLLRRSVSHASKPHVWVWLWADGRAADIGEPPVVRTVSPERWRWLRWLAMSSAEISIVLADDHAVVRGALRALLEDQPDLSVVGEAGDLSTARAAVLELKPRVLILDVNMPDGLAIDAIAGLREEAPETEIVLLTMERDLTLVRRAIERARSAICSRMPRTWS